MNSTTTTSIHIHITGIVQGVGFRPFVYRLAEQYRLCGWVRNTSSGVEIAVEGEETALRDFVHNLKEQAPPLAHIDSLEVSAVSPQGFDHFEILSSQAIPAAFQPISADIGICPDCLQELFTPSDRRYRYPFINCTHCGPRYTIIQDIPYDRPNTTMAAFAMCPDCAAEYHDPANRRFHAQPVACPVCGPQIWLEHTRTEAKSAPLRGEAALQAARQLLAEGKIVAIKGLGGFHLACDATNNQAVMRLRQRKQRNAKPLAVMVNDLAEAEKHAVIGHAARDLLSSPERPILILEQRLTSQIAPQVAPGQNTLGIMLPYTPLHYLLLEPAPGYPTALVMTSGNLSEEPLVKGNAEARQRLQDIADALLLHDRDIHVRCDDSVVRIFQGWAYPVRRARGFAPAPIHLPWRGMALLAAGAELKNAFCLTREHYAFLSQHIGDLSSYRTMEACEKNIAHLESLLRVRPEALACDLHPDYLATRYAQERAARENLPLVRVQHHHAHLAACMAENKIPPDEPVIGAIFDGTGYGLDGTIWGGEILLGTYRSFKRLYHLDAIPMPGGDLAVRQPWRLALAWLERAEIPWTQDLPPVQHALAHHPEALPVLQHQLAHRLNTPLTSSIGRLFDAISSLLDVRHEVHYEGQAAIELEASVAAQQFGMYPILITGDLFDPLLMIRRIVEDLRDGVPQAVIAARFHNTLAMTVSEVARRIRTVHGIRHIALSGGVWQNMTLLGRTVETLRNDDFEVLIHQSTPPNDGCVAFGQAVVAQQRLQAT
ncbi:MAG: carbamoyltransferase HypF [Anaerolineales bacterium]